MSTKCGIACRTRILRLTMTARNALIGSIEVLPNPQRLLIFLYRRRPVDDRPADEECGAAALSSSTSSSDSSSSMPPPLGNNSSINSITFLTALKSPLKMIEAIECDSMTLTACSYGTTVEGCLEPPRTPVTEPVNLFVQEFEPVRTSSLKWLPG